MSDCGNWLIVTPLKDCRDNLVYFTPLKPGMSITNNLPLTQVVDKLEADYEVIINISFLKVCYISILLQFHVFLVCD